MAKKAKKPVIKSKRLNSLLYGHYVFHSPKSGDYEEIRARCWRTQPKHRRYTIQYFKTISIYSIEPDRVEYVSSFEQLANRIREIVPLNRWRSSTELNFYYYAGP